MTLVAVVRQDRLDVPAKVDLHGRRWHQPAVVNLGGSRPARRAASAAIGAAFGLPTLAWLPSSCFTLHASRLSRSVPPRHLVPQTHIDVRTMHRRVASRGPAGAHPQISDVVFLADIDVPGGHAPALDLRMASEAEVQIVAGSTAWR